MKGLLKLKFWSSNLEIQNNVFDVSLNDTGLVKLSKQSQTNGELRFSKNHLPSISS
jgi:hypothetical protein